MLALEVKNLTKQYDDIKVVNGISFDVKPGEIFGFLGPNGAGKTTTIRMIIGEKKPNKGEINIFGLKIPEKLDEIATNIGVIPDYQNLYDRLSVRQNLEIFCDLYAINYSRVDELLEALDLTDHHKKTCVSLSRGLRQRVLIARAMLHKPSLIFLDEPTSALDPHSALLIRNLIKDLKANGTTIFLTTHYMEEADSLCDRIAIMNKGQVIALDTPQNLKIVHGKPFINILTKENSLELPLGSEETASIVADLIRSNSVVKMHTQEASLEKVFMAITGDNWNKSESKTE